MHHCNRYIWRVKLTRGETVSEKIPSKLSPEVVICTKTNQVMKLNLMSYNWEQQTQINLSDV